jgi:hypothetical protein
MTVHRDRFLVKKPTDALSSNFLLVIITLHISRSLSAYHQGLLSCTTLLVQFMQLGDRVLPGSGPVSGRSVLILVALGQHAA